MKLNTKYWEGFGRFIIVFVEKYEDKYFGTTFEIEGRFCRYSSCDIWHEDLFKSGDEVAIEYYIPDNEIAESKRDLIKCTFTDFFE